MFEVGSIHLVVRCVSTWDLISAMEAVRKTRAITSHLARFFLGDAGSSSALSFLSRAISSSVSSPTTPPALPPPRNSLLSFIAAALASTNAGSVSGSVSELSSLELELDDELVFSPALSSARRG